MVARLLRAPERGSPEYLAWLEEQREYALDVAMNHGYTPETYFPEAYDKEIPENGAWIIVIDVPHTALQWDVPPLSMWRARPHVCNFGAIEYRPTGHAKSETLRFLPKQAVIATPGGDLHLWGHEYVVCQDPLAILGDPDVEVVMLGGQAVFDEQRMFYLQSRGIDHETAARLLIGDVETLDYAYAVMPQYAVDVFYGVGQRVPMPGLRIEIKVS